MPYPTPNYSLAIMAKTTLWFYENNPVLANLQIGIESDTNRFKIGDGTSGWNALGYGTVGNPAGVWIGKSPDAGNLLELTAARAGFFLDPAVFDGHGLVNQGANGAVTDITPWLTANQHLAGFVAAGIMIRKVIMALGSDWNVNSTDPIPATTVTQAIATVMNSVSTLNTTVSQLINDTTADTTHTYSSTKINALIAQAVSDLVGGAPGALDTLYELSAALQNNPNLVTNIVNDLATTIKVTAQTLTAPQQTQARTNISAAYAEDLGSSAENTSTLSAKYSAEKSAAAGSVQLDYVPNPLPVVKTTAFVAKPKSDGSQFQEGLYSLNTTAGAFIVQMPPNPTVGDRVEFLDHASTFSTNPAELQPNGQKFMGLTESYFLDQTNRGREFVYVDANKGWMPLS